MDYNYRIDYKSLTDRQIVDIVLSVPHNEEAAFYLLYNRYNLLLHKIYRMLTKDDIWFEDCLDELFIHLRGKDGSWHALANFEWRSKFGHWLTRVAKNKFKEVLSKLIENGGFNLSIDNDDQDRQKIQLSDEESRERRMKKVMLLEAISLMNNDDYKFVILKRLEGYNSKEMAILLHKRWQKHGIMKYNNKHEVVIPDEHYVNTCMERAKKTLKKHLA